MKKVWSILWRVLTCLVVLFGLFWFQLPPIHIKSGEFWRFVFNGIIACVIINGCAGIIEFIRDHKNGEVQVKGFTLSKLKTLPLALKIIGIVIAAMILLSLIFSLIGAQFFNASRYANLITLQDGDFSADVAELSMTQIPVVDRDTATRLGQRKLGEMNDLVSQFEIEDDYTQINFKNNPVRVTPLKYADFVKWATNSDEGIPAYISVNLTTQEAQLVRLKDLGLDNIRYARSEYFLRNVDRWLRFNYPTKIFGEVSFEIDEEGTPYWIASVIQYRIGFWSGEDIGGVVLLNAVTGESEYYNAGDAPKWVDQVYNESILFDQLRYNGLLSGGFWNSIFGQRGCVAPTDGYNYLAMDDDVWMYTGITSVTADESNVGFVLVNLRTKEARYYVQAGAEEYSAMDSAEGQIQEKNYESTFPLLLNVGGRPTYFMSLKDDAGLVKMYAYVDMAQYQIVGTGSSVNEARANYLKMLKNENIEAAPEVPEDTETVSGRVTAVASAVIDGNTRYYVMLGEDTRIHVLSAALSDALPFVKAGDTVTITYAGDTVTAVTVG